MEKLESLIGYRFTNPSLLEEALTHASLPRSRDGRPRPSNQRLEFLGDAVLQLTLSALLFREMPGADEGALSKARARMVSTRALAGLARTLSLGEFLVMDRGEEANGGRDREGNLADAFEALAGAVYLDSDPAVCGEWLCGLFQPLLAAILEAPQDPNPKGALQELVQAINREAPTYEVSEISGPDHQRLFQVRVSWNGRQLASGSGRSKKEAEAAAAHAALEKRSTWLPRASA
jgi:ribonuclease-3